LACSLPATSSKKMISSLRVTLESRFSLRRAARTRFLTSMIFGSTAFRILAVDSFAMSAIASPASCGPPSPPPSAAAVLRAFSSILRVWVFVGLAARREETQGVRALQKQGKQEGAARSALLPPFLLPCAPLSGSGRAGGARRRGGAHSASATTMSAARAEPEERSSPAFSSAMQASYVACVRVCTGGYG